MVGIVLVSHSRPLALAAKALVLSMTGPDLPLAIAAGAGEDHAELGTDATEIAESITSVMSDDGVLVLMDMGSAILSAEMALEFLDEDQRNRVRFCAAPFLEGAVAAGVTANLGNPLDDIAREAEQSLGQKQEHLKGPEASVPDSATPKVAPTPTNAIVEPAESVVVTVRNPHGLHARPAALFIRTAGQYDAEVSVSNTTTGKGPVSARSLSALATLEVEMDHTISIGAAGRQARQAIDSLRALVESGMGDAIEAPSTAATVASEPSEAKPTRAQPIADGIVIGPAVFVGGQSIEVSKEPASDPDQEKQKLRAALATARAGLEQQRLQMAQSADAASAEIFAAQQMLLDDPILIDRADELITSEHLNAAAAWHASYQAMVDQYQNLKDEYLRQRATDVADVGRRVLHALGVITTTEFPRDRQAVLVVDDLTPTQAAQLAGSKILGVVCLDGGRTSHSAILLRAMGLPSIAQARPLLANIEGQRENVTIAFDGGSGELFVNPDEARVADLRQRQAAWSQQQLRQKQAATDPATTTDGHHVELFANVGNVDDSRAAVESGAEGVGLLRTEFLFLDRPTAPDEDEQVAALQPIVEAMGDRPIIVRTLDAGGDKPLTYLALPKEANPFLGVRALRISLRRPQMFQLQLRALLRVGAGRKVHIMFPMIAEPAELEAAMSQVERAHRSLAREGVPHAWPVKCGIMVEIPSAALLADEFAARCDFFSIGTNDLTQYTLAADRGNTELAEYQDAMHPAVLRLIQQIAEAGNRHGKPVAICGEAAGEVQAALVFVGLGVNELSVTPSAIPRIKDAIRRASYADLQALAKRVVAQTSAAQVRDEVSRWVNR